MSNQSWLMKRIMDNANSTCRGLCYCNCFAYIQYKIPGNTDGKEPSESKSRAPVECLARLPTKCPLHPAPRAHMLTLKGRHPCGIVCFKPQKNTENLLWPPLKLFVDVEMINGVMGMGDVAKKGMRVSETRA